MQLLYFHVISLYGGLFTLLIILNKLKLSPLGILMLHGAGSGTFGLDLYVDPVKKCPRRKISECYRNK